MVAHSKTQWAFLDLLVWLSSSIIQASNLSLSANLPCAGCGCVQLPGVAAHGAGALPGGLSAAGRHQHVRQPRPLPGGAHPPRHSAPQRTTRGRRKRGGIRADVPSGGAPPGLLDLLCCTQAGRTSWWVSRSPIVFVHMTYSVLPLPPFL
jgi:hypothetical protein